jgi:hypothetical protein
MNVAGTGKRDPSVSSAHPGAKGGDRFFRRQTKPDAEAPAAAPKKGGRLSEPHLDEAKRMVLRHRRKNKCNKCFDRGYTGVTDDNMLVPCTHCIHNDALMDEWRAYVKKHPELVELYGDSLDDKENAPTAKE